MAQDWTLEAWRKAGKTHSYKGHDIFYVASSNWDDNTKPVLMLIHGFPTASYDWTRIWAGLEKRFRLIAPDMIGFGWSSKPVQHAYTMMEQADLHQAFLQKYNIERFHILTHDYGVTVTQELLARFEEDNHIAGAIIQSVCFLNGGLFPETHLPTFTQKMLHGPLGPFLSRLMSQKKFSKGFSEVFGEHTKPDAQELEDFWALAIANGGMPRIGHKLLGYIDERKAYRSRWVSVLQQTKVPLRVIDGAADPVSGAHMVARYEELVPNPDTVLLDGIGHYPQWEAPQDVLSAFMAFHDKIGTA